MLKEYLSHAVLGGVGKGSQMFDMDIRFISKRLINKFLVTSVCLERILCGVHNAFEYSGLWCFKNPLFLQIKLYFFLYTNVVESYQNSFEQFGGHMNIPPW